MKVWVGCKNLFHSLLLLPLVSAMDLKCDWILTSYLRKAVFRSTAVIPRSLCVAKEVKENSCYKCYCNILPERIIKWTVYPHIWQDENLVGQDSRNLGRVITSGNLVRKGYSQKHKAEAAPLGMRGHKLKCWVLCTRSQRWALDKLLAPYLTRAILMEAMSKPSGTQFRQLFCLPTRAKVYAHAKQAAAEGNQWLLPTSPEDGQTPFKEDSHVQAAVEHDATTPHNHSMIPPSPGNSRSKSGSSLNSTPFP